MSIKIEKKILESFIEKLVENRTEDPHYKTFEEDPEDETPIEASAHMSTQLSVEAPPVEDPEYMPGTKEEVGRAAKYLQTISSLLRRIHPEIAKLATKYYQNIDSKTLDYMTTAKPFFAKLNKIKNKKNYLKTLRTT